MKKIIWGVLIGLGLFCSLMLWFTSWKAPGDSALFSSEPVSHPKAPLAKLPSAAVKSSGTHNTIEGIPTRLIEQMEKNVDPELVARRNAQEARIRAWQNPNGANSMAGHGNP